MHVRNILMTWRQCFERVLQVLSFLHNLIIVSFFNNKVLFRYVVLQHSSFTNNSSIIKYFSLISLLPKWISQTNINYLTSNATERCYFLLGSYKKKKDNLCEIDCFVFVISISLLQFILGYVVFLLISAFRFLVMNLYLFSFFPYGNCCNRIYFLCFLYYNLIFCSYFSFISYVFFHLDTPWCCVVVP